MQVNIVKVADAAAVAELDKLQDMLHALNVL
jgi:hypothetical protein